MTGSRRATRCSGSTPPAPRAARRAGVGGPHRPREARPAAGAPAARGRAADRGAGGVHPGEYATANRDALILFGDLSTLCVRVDVDEESAPLVRGSPAAVAFVRGFPEAPVPLEFVRVEPSMRPKRSLTGATSERVDTRVLQGIFRVGTSEPPVRVGQQVDVYMEAAPRSGEAVK